MIFWCYLKIASFIYCVGFCFFGSFNLGEGGTEGGREERGARSWLTCAFCNGKNGMTSAGLLKMESAVGRGLASLSGAGRLAACYSVVRGRISAVDVVGHKMDG